MPWRKTHLPRIVCDITDPVLLQTGSKTGCLWSTMNFVVVCYQPVHQVALELRPTWWVLSMSSWQSQEETVIKTELSIYGWSKAKSDRSPIFTIGSEPIGVYHLHKNYTNPGNSRWTEGVLSSPPSWTWTFHHTHDWWSRSPLRGLLRPEFHLMCKTLSRLNNKVVCLVGGSGSDWTATPPGTLFSTSKRRRDLVFLRWSGCIIPTGSPTWSPCWTVAIEPSGNWPQSSMLLNKLPGLQEKLQPQDRHTRSWAWWEDAPQQHWVELQGSRHVFPSILTNSADPLQWTVC